MLFRRCDRKKRTARAKPQRGSCLTFGISATMRIYSSSSETAVAVLRERRISSRRVATASRICSDLRGRGIAHSALLLRRSGVIEPCFREEGKELQVFRREAPLFISLIVSSLQSPNKAPEPTPGLVTPRALECASEMKRRTAKRDAARVAPSPVVAHL